MYWMEGLLKFFLKVYCIPKLKKKIRTATFSFVFIDSHCTYSSPIPFQAFLNFTTNNTKYKDVSSFTTALSLYKCGALAFGTPS